MSSDLSAEKVSVLVVDDSDDQRMLMTKYFEKAGCEVRFAATAGDAVRECAEHAPELVVIDLVLPGMDGWELAEHVRVHHPESSIVISSVMRQARYPGAYAALPKPFTSSSVRNVLRECVPRWVAA